MRCSKIREDLCQFFVGTGLFFQVACAFHALRNSKTCFVFFFNLIEAWNNLAIVLLQYEGAGKDGRDGLPSVSGKMGQCFLNLHFLWAFLTEQTQTVFLVCNYLSFTSPNNKISFISIVQLRFHQPINLTEPL